MISALRISLAITFVPISMLAAFFVCYAALNPSYWVANVPPAGKSFQVGAMIIATATGFLIWRRTRLERHPWFAASLLAFGLIVIAYAVTAIFEGLGRF
ncbi:hypothetical protein [Sphingomonas sp. 2SG]|uniref:hypothetical protein n=1 Tax=Sphingomonas sp. 2SG TaxID=2502201 RepID=UPI0010F668C4|nr:hypothetical protein [Sphingomonas sp. 2SG]